MDVTSRAVTRGTHIAHHLSALDLIPHLHLDAGAMPVTGAVTIAMFDGDQSPISRFPSCVGHDAISGGPNGGIDLIGDINAQVPARFPGEGRGSFTESRSDPTLDEPKRRGRGQDGALLVQVGVDLLETG